MCLIIFAWQYHSDYPLIVVANRDEYYQRPTEPAHRWEQPEGILAGRDLAAGGTWLGITPEGKFSAVTNYREGLKEDAPCSRGDLTTDFLKSDISAEQYAQKTISRGNQYNGFNLLLGSNDQLIYCSNRNPEVKPLPAGVYSLSNQLLDSPWPKATHAKEALSPLLKTSLLDIDQMINCLQRREPFADELLPNTGVGIELERMLSPPFIVSPNYGTRCTTVVLRDKKGNTTFVEQSYQPDGSAGKRSSFYF